MEKSIEDLVEELMALALQYRDDLKYPPAADSAQRRQKWIDRVMALAADALKESRK